MRQECLRILNGGKTDQGLELLRDFCLTMHWGEITFIIGASVLELNSIAKILSGEDRFDCGHVYCDGCLMDRAGDMSFWRDKITVLDADDDVIESVSIVDNFFICTRARQPFFARDKQNKMILKELLRTFDVDIDVNQPVRTLRTLQRRQLQLLKLFYHDKNTVVVLDKRKFQFSDQEFQALCSLMSKLRRRGMTFLVLDYTASYTIWDVIDVLVVVQEACTIFQADMAFLSDKERYRLLGDEIRLTPRSVSKTGPEESIVLELEHISAEFLRDMEFQIHRGEAAVIYYSDSETAWEFIRVLNGLKNAETGTFRIRGRPLDAGSYAKNWKKDIWCLYPYGSEIYLFHNLTALENYCLPKGLRFKQIWRSRRYREYFKRYLDSVMERDISELYPRELLPKEAVQMKLRSMLLLRPSVLVCLDPFASVDRQMRDDVETLLNQLCANGTSVIVLSRLRQAQEMRQYTQYTLTAEGKLIQNLPN